MQTATDSMFCNVLGEGFESDHGEGGKGMGEEKPRADLEKRVIQLEELYSHQQHLVQQLDEELVKLRSVIEKLEYRHVVQEDRLKWLIDNRLTLDDLPNEKPPHY